MPLTFEELEPERRAEFGELAILALEIMTLYARVIENIGWVVGESTRNSDDHRELRSDYPKSPEVERPKTFLEIVNAQDVSGDRSQFLIVFNRVKATRDHLAHALIMYASESGPVRVSIPYYKDGNGDRRRKTLDAGKSAITTALATKRIKELKWLLAHVEWVRLQLDQRGGPVPLQTRLQKPPPVKP